MVEFWEIRPLFVYTWSYVVKCEMPTVSIKSPIPIAMGLWQHEMLLQRRFGTFLLLMMHHTNAVIEAQIGS